ncbi:uncharacterized protein LOC125419571 [Ziziphus jujuba]|uniref:Uncharacterized protein LOC125419571 n=1 Tax=Ziziphus jujuba TaxID=326968 RepID=A0ABM3ZWQ1_ZIZJJ|nr:uncharacterized protein LOC125419571 [Ziziphus jujuba]
MHNHAGRFLDYMMVDTKLLMSQVHELQVLIQELLVEGMFINEAFQVAVMTKKLPLSLRDFKNYLKHKRKEALVGKLQIEYDNRKSDQRSMKIVVKTNVVEHGSSLKTKKKPGNSSIWGLKDAYPRRPMGSNIREWWIDTGATHNVCASKSMFTSFEPKEIGEKLFMGNSTTSEIQGDGKIVLQMTSGKNLTLNNILYVLDIRKNLVSR